MLNYITQFENVQIVVILGIGLVAAIFSVGFNIRRGMLVEDVKAENEMRRKIQWKNIEDRKAIESHVIQTKK
jgi:hypothetical protein